QLKVVDGIVYCNDGDWIENCTALVEQENGRIELLHWSETQRVINSADITIINDSQTKPEKSAA
ncbi:hypothetical protein SOO12_14125, partial [Staphylococcus aureus]